VAATLRAAIGAPPQPVDQTDLDRAIASVQMAIGDAAFASAWAAGAALPETEAIAEATALAAELAGVGSSRPKPVASAGLTRREVEVLRLLKQGETDREIAAALFVSPRTVGAHVTSILRKLGVTNRQGARAYARRHDLG
jgi:DNA-binding NarL/FixJ family response regulator